MLLPPLPQSWLWEGHRVILGSCHWGNQTLIRWSSHTIASPGSLWSITAIIPQALDSPTQNALPDCPLAWPGATRGARTAAAAPHLRPGRRDSPKAMMSTVRTSTTMPSERETFHRALVRLLSTCWDWTPNLRLLRLHSCPLRSWRLGFNLINATQTRTITDRA